MMRRFLLTLVMLLCARSAAAQTFETVGARALGMGGAFVAVADDASAVWWNPAGLANGPLFSLGIERSVFTQERAGRFGESPATDRSSFFLGAASLPLGLSYIRTRETYVGLGPAGEALIRDLVTHQAGVTVLQSITDAVVVGGTMKYVRGNAASGPVGEDPDGAGGHALDADLSVMVVSGQVKAGLTLRNILSPQFEAPDGTRLELPWMGRAGVAYLATPALTVAADVDLRALDLPEDRRRMLAIGSEYRFTRFAVRAGARFDSIGAVNPLGTVGGSYAVRNGIWVDVWAAAGSRRADRGWGLAGRVVY